jgi:hypothetical protein
MDKNHDFFVYTKRLVASGSVSIKAVYISSVIIGTDGINDPVVTCYNDTDANTAANRVIPPVTYSASVNGMNGATFAKIKRYDNGFYVNISNLGSGEVMVDYRELDDLPEHAHPN